MRDIRQTQFRQAAADCLELAKVTEDRTIRAALVVMAQGWLELSDGPFDDTFRRLLEEFNDHQMANPSASHQGGQQQQQTQPKGR